MHTVLNVSFIPCVYCFVGVGKSDFNHMYPCAKMKCFQFTLSVHSTYTCSADEAHMCC